ncbi:MAG: RnfABCDGE type electron transport complex subunit D [Methylococcaceae bacterium]
MLFLTDSGPYLKNRPGLDRMMLGVTLALLPGSLTQIWMQGWGLIYHAPIAILSALLFEAMVLLLRGRPVRATLSDGSTVLTAVLLAVCLPPLTPWWVTVIGAAVAIILAKQLYGGLGYNVFNPAMVAYAVLLVSFPRLMTVWPHANLDLITTGQYILSQSSLDGLTGATPLDAVKTQWIQVGASGELPAFAPTAPHWAWINLAYALGGVWLVSQRWCDWRIPTGFLAAFFAISLVAYLSNPQHYPTPLFQLSAGATMLGAFFIATDPVTAASSPRGRWIYAIGIGTILALIRLYGSYPDGVAFAVLIMNFVVPTLDRYTRPRVYGSS